MPCPCVIGELVVDQLLSKYGPKRSAWPKKLLKNLEDRNAALLAAVIERVGFVPKELFWPLGQAAKDLITNKEGALAAGAEGQRQLGSSSRVGLWPALYFGGQGRYTVERSVQFHAM
jgi:hypothetical protein